MSLGLSIGLVKPERHLIWTGTNHGGNPAQARMRHKPIGDVALPLMLAARNLPPTCSERVTGIGGKSGNTNRNPFPESQAADELRLQGIGIMSPYFHTQYSTLRHPSQNEPDSSDHVPLFPIVTGYSDQLYCGVVLPLGLTPTKESRNERIFRTARKCSRFSVMRLWWGSLALSDQRHALSLCDWSRSRRCRRCAVQ